MNMTILTLRVSQDKWLYHQQANNMLERALSVESMSSCKKLVTLRAIKRWSNHQPPMLEMAHLIMSINTRLTKLLKMSNKTLNT